MAYLNKVMLIGNLGKNPVFANTASGKTKVTFSIATSQKYKASNGETREQTYWHNVIAWGKTSDIIRQLNIAKGDTLYIEGTLTNRQFEDKASGQKNFFTEILLENFQLLKQKQENGYSSSSSYTNKSQVENQYGSPSYDDDIENLPF